MAKISDDEARASYHTMALFPTLRPRYSHNPSTNEFNDWHNFEFNWMHRNVREEWQLRFGRGNGARDVELGRHQPGYALGELERSGVPPPDLTLHPPMQALGQGEWNDDFGLVQDIIDPNRFWAREEVPPELMPLPEDIPENFEGDEASEILDLNSDIHDDRIEEEERARHEWMIAVATNDAVPPDDFDPTIFDPEL